MKKLVSCFLIVIFISCSKEKEVSIVGSWREIALYGERTPGVFEWGPANRFPLNLTFKAEGEYSALQEMFGDRGSYKYDRSTRELIFVSAFSITYNTKVVSFLDEETMEIEYLYNGVMNRKLRFARKQ